MNAAALGFAAGMRMGMMQANPAMGGGFPMQPGMGGFPGAGMGFPGGMDGSMFSPELQGGMLGMNPMMGLMNPMMGGPQSQQMMMMQLIQLLQVLMQAMGQGQMGGQPGAGMPGGGMPGGGCGIPGGGIPNFGNAFGGGGGFPGGGNVGGGGFPGGGNFGGVGNGNFGGGNVGGGGFPGGGNIGGSNNIGTPGPYNAATGSQLANTALSYAGTNFKPGQTCRCADFVSTMLEKSGTAPPGFQHQMSAAGLAGYGSPVGRGDLKPGDVVFFGNTYRPGQYTHVGIYVGDGKFVHRPTADKPVQISDLNNSYYSQHYTGARRMASGDAQPQQGAPAVNGNGGTRSLADNGNNGDNGAAPQRVADAGPIGGGDNGGGFGGGGGGFGGGGGDLGGGGGGGGGLLS